jgi:hypothetical protein
MAWSKIPVVDDATGHVQYIEPDVHRALLAVGIIRPDGDEWRCAEPLDVFPYPELAVCDFCSGRPVVWDIDAADFSIDNPQFASVGGWAACEPCGLAVAAGDRERLFALSVGELKGLPAAVAVLVAWEHSRLLAAFWQHFRRITRYASPYAATPEAR